MDSNSKIIEAFKAKPTIKIALKIVLALEKEMKVFFHYLLTVH